MFDPSALAPFVTRTFVQAWLLVLMAPANVTASKAAALVKILILFFYLYSLFLLDFWVMYFSEAQQQRYK
jgi:hypothetical protein